MRGRIDMQTRFELPPGEREVIRRMALDGDFALDQATFMNIAVQRRISELSQRGRGDETPEAGESVVSKLRGQFALASDETVLGFLRPQGSEARYVTSVCTGALLLGAAGLLQGYAATTHWAFVDLLPRFGARPERGSPALSERQWIEGLAEILDIAPLLTRRVNNLSGGERQRVAIGRALMTKPALMLLDEPLAAVDRARREQILPYLLRIRRELHVPLIYVTHDAHELLQIADRVLVIEDGRAVRDGLPRHVLQ